MVDQEDVTPDHQMWDVIMEVQEAGVTPVEGNTPLDPLVETTHHHLETIHLAEAMAIHHPVETWDLQEDTLLWIPVMVNTLQDQCILQVETILPAAGTTHHLDVMDVTVLQ